MPHNPIPGHDDHEEPQPHSATQNHTRQAQHIDISPEPQDSSDTSSTTTQWYNDDRVGLVVAGAVVTLVLLAAWAAHRDD